MQFGQCVDGVSASGAQLTRGRRCPGCGEHVIAPELSQLVDGGEIRHHWLCENCARVFSEAIETGALLHSE
jgi:hypothetical protein